MPEEFVWELDLLPLVSGFYQHLWVSFPTCPCRTIDFPSRTSIYGIINVNEVCLAINLCSSKFIPLAQHLAWSGLCFMVTNWRTPSGGFQTKWELQWLLKFPTQPQFWVFLTRLKIPSLQQRQVSAELCSHDRLQLCGLTWGEHERHGNKAQRCLFLSCAVTLHLSDLPFAPACPSSSQPGENC